MPGCFACFGINKALSRKLSTQQHHNSTDDLPTVLPYDILLSLPAYADAPCDILALMLTCKTIYPPAMRALVQLGGCNFRSQRQMSSFCDFIMKDISERGPLVKRLGFMSTLGRLQDDSLQNKLIYVLQHVPSLQSLTLVSCDNFLLSPKTMVVFQSLSCVDTLYLEDTGANAVERMFSHIQSPLKICRIGIVQRTIADYGAISIGYNLWRSARTTLQTLIITNPLELVLRYPNGAYVFQAVTRLELEGGKGDILLSPVIRAFPNVRELVLSGEAKFTNKSWRIQVANEEFQLRKRWPHLERVVGGAVNLYAAGLRASIDVLDVYVEPDTRPEVVASILRHGHPLRFNLRLETSLFLNVKKLPEMLEIAGREVTHLYQGFDEAALGYGLEQFSLALSRMPKLTYLSFKSDSQEWETEDENNLYRDLPRRFAMASSSLEYLVISIPSIGTSCWRISRTAADLASGTPSTFELESLNRGQATRLGLLSEQSPLSLSKNLMSELRITRSNVKQISS